jgi:hypothetical chaperone protein
MSHKSFGIDFGTSNSAVALAGGASVELVTLEAGQVTMPSAVFFNADTQSTVFGRLAVEEYLDGYTGRLMRSLKSILGSDLITEATQIENRKLYFREIIGMFIGHLKEVGEAAAGEEIDSVVMGRPVFFVDGNPEADQRAQEELEALVRMQGFKNVSFEYEPIAAARDYESDIQKEELVLIADIGGGTSDFSVIRLSPEARERSDRSRDILGTGGIHIGGTDFDRQFSLGSVMPEMGYKTMLNRGLTMPMGYYTMLSSWHLINSLYIQKNVIGIKGLKADALRKDLVQRLITTVDQQRGHEVASNVEAAKIALSDAATTQMDLGYIEKGWRLELTAEDLMQAIQRDILKICEEARTTVLLAGLQPGEIETIFMTGGSTGLPGFEQEIRKMFPDANIIFGNRFASVAKGLGLCAAQRYA